MAVTTCAVVLLLCACAVHPVVQRSDGEQAKLRDAILVAAIRELGNNGDWLVARGYHVSDNVVATITNMPFSHAAVLDISADEVIEAESVGVHVSSLSHFVENSERVMLIRPMWASNTASAAALRKARSVVNRPYDFLGVIGLSVPDSYYCSELAIEVYRPYIRSTDVIPRPVPPGQLHHWGKILFDSGAP